MKRSILVIGVVVAVIAIGAYYFNRGDNAQAAAADRLAGGQGNQGRGGQGGGGFQGGGGGFQGGNFGGQGGGGGQ